ncbi:hypothetical protein [Arthrobacter sp. D1-29]
MLANVMQENIDRMQGFAIDNLAAINALAGAMVANLGCRRS